MRSTKEPKAIDKLWAGAQTKLSASNKKTFISYASYALLKWRNKLTSALSGICVRHPSLSFPPLLPVPPPPPFPTGSFKYFTGGGWTYPVREEWRGGDMREGGVGEKGVADASPAKRRCRLHLNEANLRSLRC
jgi:hypothetical protein